MATLTFDNPFKPGAGHMPPYLAGRDEEQKEFERLLKQSTILENAIITGLRGTGKTVLLETLKPIAFKNKWLWVGTDLSESASTSEETLAIRLLTDLSVVTSGIVVGHEKVIGLHRDKKGEDITLNYNTLLSIFQSTPGLIADKLKATLEMVWGQLKNQYELSGVIFAYDEAQNMADHGKKEQYPLSVLLDVFQSIQRKNIPFMLVLVGLPTLFSKLVDVRTYSERMFRILTLGKLSEKESQEAIEKPIHKANCPVKFNEDSINLIIKESRGYPYFIQFICRELYDLFLSQISRDETPSVPIKEITAKLDSDFFSGRWMRTTDRQKELLKIISMLVNCEEEFSAQEIHEKMAQSMTKPMSPSQINQMLGSLADAGLIHKSRHGKYLLAVPLLSKFIQRQEIKLA